jgi:hypothetical protein
MTTGFYTNSIMAKVNYKKGFFDYEINKLDIIKKEKIYCKNDTDYIKRYIEFLKDNKNRYKTSDEAYDSLVKTGNYSPDDAHLILKKWEDMNVAPKLKKQPRGGGSGGSTTTGGQGSTTTGAGNSRWFMDKMPQLRRFGLYEGFIS